jgi:flagellar hook-basal body complex protein FliE
MSGALNSVFGSVGGAIANAALNVASVAFPPLGIATSIGNLVAQGLGPAINAGLQSLTTMAGMPKFIAQEIGDLLKGVIDKMQQPSDPDCDQHVHDQFRHEVRDFQTAFSDSFVKYAVEEMGGGKARGKQSWFEAVATALGKALNEQAEDVKAKSEAVVGKKSTDDPKAFTDLQAASQRMGFMMSAADQVIKGLGEALATAARKG